MDAAAELKDRARRFVAWCRPGSLAEFIEICAAAAGTVVFVRWLMGDATVDVLRPLLPLFGVAFFAYLLWAIILVRRLLSPVPTASAAQAAPGPIAQAKVTFQQVEQTAAHLSREQEHFRLGLRTLVTRLVTAHGALRLVIDRAASVGSSHNELISLATQSIGFMRPNVTDIQKVAQIDIAKMEQQRLQELVVEFLRHNYGETQTVLRRLCEGLRRYGVTLSPAVLDEGQQLTQWLAADAECLRTLRDLKTSPEAAVLKSAPEKYFGTVARERWNAQT
jgi:hypothetical protein